MYSERKKRIEKSAFWFKLFFELFLNPFTITIAIPKAANITSPHLPVLNTHPFPLAVTQMLSRAFGNTYIANSPLRLSSSTNSDSPAANPGIPNEIFEMRRSMTHCGRCLSEELTRFVWNAPERTSERYLCKLCLPQNIPM